jgi:hypothetical protein
MSSAEVENTPENSALESSWSSAPKLSRKVRELAHRSFHALRFPSLLGSLDQARSTKDLQDLRDQVVLLQQKIHVRNLEALIPWVDALRRQVDDGLDHVRKEQE